MANHVILADIIFSRHGPPRFGAPSRLSGCAADGTTSGT